MSSTVSSKNNQQIYDESIKSLAAYFVDVVGESGLPSREQIALGLDHIYRPIPEFWLHFAAEMVLTALSIACPDWKQTDDRLRRRGESFFVNVSLALINRKLHECLAEEFLSVPSEQRPSSKDAIFKWFCSVLSESGQTVVLKLVKNQGQRCTKKVLRIVQMREAALAHEPSGHAVGIFA